MKKYLLSLLIGFVGFISFCSALDIFNFLENKNVSSSNSLTGTCAGYCCFTTTNFTANNRQSLMFNSNIQLFPSSYNAYDLSCIDYNGNFIISSSTTSVVNVRYYDFSSLKVACPSCPDCPSCPACPGTGSVCSGYNFNVILPGIMSESYPISSDVNLYVGSNVSTSTLDFPDVFVSSSGGIYSGDSNWSLLYINDVLHESAPLINISIPQEYSWDYSVDSNEFNLDISGYNVDYEYIDGIITTQNTKPSKGDFNKIISELIPLFIPGLVIILFLYFVFKFIKKLF